MFSSVKSAFLSVRRAPPYDGDMTMTDELVKKRGGGNRKSLLADIVCWAANVMMSGLLKYVRRGGN